MSTFYEELGVPNDIDQVELKKALRRKALECHPDKHPPEEQQKWTEKFQHLQLIMETFEDEKSRHVYDEIHLRKERTSRILVLMDMNGSLLCKLGKDGKDGYPGKSSGRPDFSDRNNEFWVRPHVKEFLESILHPTSKIAFAIYTSRQMKNALPQVTMLFKSINRPDLQDQLFAIFAGDEFSVPDPDAGPYKSKRSLPRIWKDVRTCAARGVKFDMCNTINLDNEISKIREHLENGIVVPNFGPRQIGSEDQILVELKEYLKCLAKECHGDVREYMKLFPFCKGGSASVRALPPMSTFEDAKDEDEVDRVTKQFEKVALGESEKPWVTFWMAIGPHHGASIHSQSWNHESISSFGLKWFASGDEFAPEVFDKVQRCKKRTNCSCFDVKCLHRSQVFGSKPCFIILMQSANLSRNLLQTFDENQSSLRFTALGMKSDLDKASFKFDLPMERCGTKRNPNNRDLPMHRIACRRIARSPGSKRWRSGWWQITTLLRLGGLVRNNKCTICTICTHVFPSFFYPFSTVFPFCGDLRFDGNGPGRYFYLGLLLMWSGL